LTVDIARMTLLWLITGASLAVALAAWSLARRTARRLDQFSQMHWELKYKHGELRLQIQRMVGETPPTEVPVSPEQPPETFIPLTSLKR
jgi:hypothetical protein